ncbi:unnamed protein product [Closterium sp. Naga37s-1]|nr:unnamed protein product [Closterium sp. Naga37s-1]
MTRRLLLPVLVLLAAFSGAPRSGAHSIASSGSASLPDGATCYLDSERRPVYPFCRGNKRNCVVTQVPTAPQAKYVGRCNSTYTRGSFCRYAGTPYAVGTKGVQGNALCKSCDCSYRRKMPGPNRAVCSCSSLPACYVDYNGQPVGKFRCPTEQNMCVITKIGGGGKDKKGLPVDKGVCVFSGIQGIYGAAGPSWGPKFYMAGIEGMPKPGDRCSQCSYCLLSSPSLISLCTLLPCPSHRGHLWSSRAQLGTQVVHGGDRGHAQAGGPLLPEKAALSVLLTPLSPLPSLLPPPRGHMRGGGAQLGTQGICGAAGPSWGPKFYMAGIEGMPKPGDRCSLCTCGATGGLLNCKRLANCKTPQSFSSAAELAIVLQNV